VIDLTTERKKEVSPELTGSLQEMIGCVNSLNTLTVFLDKIVSDSSNDKHSSVRRQLSGIVKTLKKKRGGEIENKKLLARARDILHANLL